MKLRLTLRVEEKYATRYDKWEAGSKYGFAEGQSDYALLKDQEGRCFYLCRGRSDGAILYKGNLYHRDTLFSALQPVWQKQGISKIYLLCCYSGAEPNFNRDGFSISSAFPTVEEIETGITCFADDDGYREIDFACEVKEERLSELPDELNFFRIAKKGGKSLND